MYKKTTTLLNIELLCILWKWKWTQTNLKPLSTFPSWVGCALHWSGCPTLPLPMGSGLAQEVLHCTPHPPPSHPWALWSDSPRKQDLPQSDFAQIKLRSQTPNKIYTLENIVTRRHFIESLFLLLQFWLFRCGKILDVHMSWVRDFRV